MLPSTALAAIVRGLAAGVAGTAAMTVAQTAYYRLTDAEPSDTPAEVGRRIVRGVLHREIPERVEPHLNTAMHWLYGSSWGVPLGLAAAGRPLPPLALFGPLCSLAVWSASLVELPAMRLGPPVWRWAPRTIATDVGFHLVYGTAAGAILRCGR